MILSFILLSIDHRHQHLHAVRSALAVAIYPIQMLIAVPMDGLRRAGNALVSRSQLVDENEHLRAANLALRARTLRFAAIQRENERLRELLGSSVGFGDDVVIADTLATETNASSHQLLINRGSRHGVYVGQPVADAGGILGQIIQVSPFSAVALLITDQRHALPVQINRNGVRAIAVGSAQPDELILSHVAINADIVPGDLVICSGLGHKFPAGYPVGEVVTVDFDPSNSFARIVVKPSAHVGRSREVLLVWPNKQLNVRTADGLAEAS